MVPRCENERRRNLSVRDHTDRCRIRDSASRDLLSVNFGPTDAGTRRHASSPK